MTVSPVGKTSQQARAEVMAGCEEIDGPTVGFPTTPRHLMLSVFAEYFASTLVHRAPPEGFKRLAANRIALDDLKEEPCLTACLANLAAINASIVAPSKRSARSSSQSAA